LSRRPPTPADISPAAERSECQQPQLRKQLHDHGFAGHVIQIQQAAGHEDRLAEELVEQGDGGPGAGQRLRFQLQPLVQLKDAAPLSMFA
jgi:hypothetical protein